MRIEVKLFCENDFTLSKDYRKNFISFLKRVFSKSGITETLYEVKRTKPYAFAVWLGDKFEIENENIKSSGTTSFLFSTGDSVIFTHFYNGIIKMKNQNEMLYLGKNKFTIKSFRLLPLKKIKSKKILCKTIGISVLTDPKENAEDFDKWFVTPNNNIEHFNDILKIRINQRYKFLTGENKEFEIELSQLNEDEFRVFKVTKDYKSKDEKPISDVIVKHYDGFLKGFRGVFWLKGDEKILQFVYDYGLGVRTGQGFGMIEILGEL